MNRQPNPVPARERRRTTRIALAIGAVGVVGAADTWLTLNFMTTVGMIELNPLARAAAGAGPAGLIGLKALSLAVHAGVLMALRRSAWAERAAWASVAVMIALAGHWSMFVDGAHEMAWADPAVLAADAKFVHLGR